jgi:hypothetical protein
MLSPASAHASVGKGHKRASAHRLTLEHLRLAHVVSGGGLSKLKSGDGFCDKGRRACCRLASSQQRLMFRPALPSLLPCLEPVDEFEKGLERA